jgi:hypothetical protein
MVVVLPNTTIRWKWQQWQQATSSNYAKKIKSDEYKKQHPMAFHRMIWMIHDTKSYFTSHIFLFSSLSKITLTSSSNSLHQ